MCATQEYLLLSGIQHFAFCRRQWALIHVEKQWQENLRTMEGQFFHEKAHTSSSQKRGDVITTCGMQVVSHELGVQGVCDVVELHRCENGVSIFGRKGTYLPVPIEYKRGKPKENEADALQLCAQAMCLEEMLLCTIAQGYLFYGETHRRQVVLLDDEIRGRVRQIFQEMHQHFRRGHTPKATVTKACKACSLEGLCLPKLGKKASAAAYVLAKLSEEDCPP